MSRSQIDRSTITDDRLKLFIEEIAGRHRAKGKTSQSASHLEDAYVEACVRAFVRACVV